MLETLCFKFESQEENRKKISFCIIIGIVTSCIEISKVDLNYRKLWERCVQLLVMYGLTLLKLSFFGKPMDKNMLSYQFVILLDQISILL
jgi:hypothetical protein